MSTVPFGKYKGRPVEEMLADADYMGWLEAQPWFRERFAHLTRKDAERLERTPVHNRLQALFLDPDYCMAFARIAAAAFFLDAADKHQEIQTKNTEIIKKQVLDLEKQIAFYDERESPLSDWEERRLEALKKAQHNFLAAPAVLERDCPVYGTRASFEASGADVLIFLDVSWKTLYGESGEVFATRFKDTELPIEIKPVVADDYPAVLRQMNRNKSRYLFIVAYEGEGATEEQFIKIFKASGRVIIKKSMVDRFVGNA